LFDFYDWEITLREVIFSVLIVGIMWFVGFLISNYIEKKEYDSVLVYRQAAQISRPEEFAHAMKTDVGMAFVQGDLKVLDPVQYDNCPGSHLSIHASFQRYQMHTQHYTTTDSKGHTRHHTRHYWSWDQYKSDDRYATTVEFCGSKMPLDTFHYSVPEDRHVHKFSGNHRVVFTTVPTSFNGTTCGDLSKGKVNGKPTLVAGIDIARLYEEKVNTFGTILFWIFWIPVMGVVVFMFLHFDNEWLED